jgi:hypothetical protein
MVYRNKRLEKIKVFLKKNENSRANFNFSNKEGALNIYLNSKVPMLVQELRGSLQNLRKFDGTLENFKK